jgi:hypothetical protein
MSSGLLLDLLLVMLLLIMIGCALVLNRRLGRLRSHKDELEVLMQNFNEATEQAVAGIDGLKAAADGAGQSLQPLINDARTLAGDLKFLNQRGEELADRLQAGTSPRRHGPVANIETAGEPGAAASEERPGLAANVGKASHLAGSTDDGLIKTLERMR